MEAGLSNSVDLLFYRLRASKRKYDSPANRSVLLLYLFIVPVIILKFLYEGDVYCPELVDYAVQNNLGCVSGVDIGCYRDRVLVVGGSTYMHDYSVVWKSPETRAVAEVSGGISGLRERSVRISVKYRSFEGEMVHRNFSSESSYCIQYYN